MGVCVHVSQCIFVYAYSDWKQRLSNHFYCTVHTQNYVVDRRVHRYISNKDHNAKAHQYETSFLRGWHFHTGTKEQLSHRPSYLKHKSHLLILAHSSINMGTNPTNAFLKDSGRREMEDGYYLVLPCVVCTEIVTMRQKRNCYWRKFSWKFFKYWKLYKNSPELKYEPVSSYRHSRQPVQYLTNIFISKMAIHQKQRFFLK